MPMPRPLLQAKIALARLLGIDQLRRERHTYRYERDEVLLQLQVLQGGYSGPSGIALRALANCLNSQVALPSAVFFAALDQARETFRDAVLGQPDALAYALLGVKVINLLIAKHEYRQGTVSTIARPIGFMLDPANQCHLGCPSCGNSYNTDFVARTYNPWPRGMMSEVTFAAFLREVGLYAFSGHFYNNHEPLLNKLTPAFVRKATDLRLRTFISSNLSYRNIDAEAIVASGLTELMVAADGATGRHAHPAARCPAQSGGCGGGACLCERWPLPRSGERLP